MSPFIQDMLQLSRLIVAEEIKQNQSGTLFLGYPVDGDRLTQNNMWGQTQKVGTDIIGGETYIKGGQT